MFEVLWTSDAKAAYNLIKNNPAHKAQYKAVKKTIGLLSDNPQHPGLQTHIYLARKGPKGEKLFEAYAQQNTPAAYRVFWCYGPAKGAITIVTIAQHS
jgi:hypothetical protein